MRCLYYGVFVGILLSGYLLTKQDEASCTAFVGTKLDQQNSRVSVQINQGNYYQSTGVLTNIDLAYSYIQSKDNSFCQDRYDLTIHEVNQILKLSYTHIVTALMALKLDNIRIAELWGLYKLGCYRSGEVKKCQKDLQQQLNDRVEKQREQVQKELQAREEERKKAEYTKRLQLVYQEHLLDFSDQSSVYFQQRQVALQKTKESNYQSYKQKRNLDEQVVGLCMAKGIDYKNLQHYTGTALQHQLYDEVVDCYKKIAKVLCQSDFSESVLAGYSLDFAVQTAEATGLEAMQLAIALSDLSHICIDAVSSIAVGVSQGVTNFAEMVLDPLGTAKNLGQAFGKVMWYVAEAMQYPDSDSIGWRYYAQQLEQEHYFDGWYAHQLIDQCKVWSEQSSWQEKVQCLSKLVVDAVLCDKFARLLLLTSGTCCSAIASIAEIRSLEAFVDIFAESKVAVDFGEVGLKSLDDLGGSILKSEMESVKRASSSIGSTVAKKRVYVDVKYHHKNSVGGKFGGKSKAPKDGQKALDQSVPFKTKGSQRYERRIGVEDDYYVIFDEHRPGEFHGHICTWEELIKRNDVEIRKALYDAGIVKNIKTGKNECSYKFNY